MFEVREDLSTDNILLKITQESIFRYYCRPFKNVGEKFNSELRDDKNASCVITEYNGKLWYKDFGVIGLRAVDCFGYLMLKYSQTFLQALGTINLDFDLGLKKYIEPLPSLDYLGLSENSTNFKKSTGLNFGATSGIKRVIPEFRNWLELDLKYWKNRYYLDIPRLEFFDIHPISKVTIEDKTIEVEMPTYSYLVDKEEGIDVVKIYSPFSRNYKWLSNCKSYHYLGFNQLPWTGENIIITKSLKDVAVLSLFKLPAIAPQSEAQIISVDMYYKLKKRFTNFYVLYDNDSAGIEGSKQTVESFSDIKPIFIPKESGVKDISDFIDTYRYKATHKLINELVWRTASL